jgi:hypothetical protein
MGEGWRLGPLELSEFVTLLRLWGWLMPLSLLHIGHSLLHGLQHLGLHYQNLLKCWWWRWVGNIVGIVLICIVIVVVVTVASLCHLGRDLR